MVHEERLVGHGYSLRVVPEYGACLTGLEWTGLNGSAIALLRPCDPQQLSHEHQAPVSCFVMAPFANRIDGGTFTFNSRSFSLRINRLDERVAIHGFSRLEPFEVQDRASNALRLVQHHQGDAFTYRVEQIVAIEADGVVVRLEVTNLGSAVMPFGLGLHPFFRREEGARLRFCASTRFLSDSRNLPTEPVDASNGPDFSRGVALDDLPWFDAHYSGLSHGAGAILRRPAAGLSVRIEAGGAFKNLHIFVPSDPQVVCIEPVSHVPNVHNRRDFAPYGNWTPLAPGESLSGDMRISADRLE